MDLRVLTSIGGGQVGGAEAFFVSLNQAMVRAGVTVRAALRNSPIHDAGLQAAAIPYDHALFGTGWDYFTTRKLARIAREFRPDIALTFATRASGRMPPGDYTFIGRLGGYYALKYFRRCDYLICITPDIACYCIDGGWPKERVFFIPNCPYLETGPAIDRATFGTPDGVPLALALGRLHVKKGLDVLIKAAAQIPDLWVWIAGEGGERKNLERLAQDLGVAGRVKFIGWRTNRVELFKAADVCVFPSRHEPFGSIVVEAWGYGVPLVTSTAKGPAWLVRDGDDGIVAPIDDVDALANGIKAVLTSPEFARRLVDNGHKRVAAEFAEDIVVRRYLDLFETLRPSRATRHAS